MSDKPIIFSAPMVRALLAGRKTQTRRVLKPQPEFRGGCGDWHDAEEWGWETEDGDQLSVLDIAPNGYHRGDRLWVREAWRFDIEWDDCKPSDFDRADAICYEADGHHETRAWGHPFNLGRLRSPIHMPRWASRLTLTVTDVRVQRLQDISEADAVAEGVDAVTMEDVPRQAAMSRRSDFTTLWNSIHGPKAWDANPWVCAISFTVTHQNIDQIGGEA